MYHKTTNQKFSIWDVFYHDVTAGTHVWLDGSTYVCSAVVGVPITVDGGSSINPTGFAYNAKQYYTSVGGYNYLWYDSANARWIISNILGYGTRETDNGAGASPRYTGDAWFTNSSSSVNGTYVPRGTLKNGTPPADKTVALGTIIGRSGSSKVGKYSPISGSGLTGDIYVGWYRMTDGTINYAEKADKYNGQPVMLGDASPFRSIWYDGSTYWIVSAAAGTADPLVGYWRCATQAGTYSRVFTGGGDPPEPSSYSITYKDCVELTGADQRKVDMIVSQVALWL